MGCISIPLNSKDGDHAAYVCRCHFGRKCDGRVVEVIGKYSAEFCLNF